MTARKAYIAAAEEEAAAIKQLSFWNEAESWNLDFFVAQETVKARESSLNCIIKSALKARLAESTLFVLVVGPKTKFVTIGSCESCNNYNKKFKLCINSHKTSFVNYISFSCDYAVKNNLDSIILYNSIAVEPEKLPAGARQLALTASIAPMGQMVEGRLTFAYESIKKAFQPFIKPSF